jgi:hypothetical protein
MSYSVAKTDLICKPTRMANHPGTSDSADLLAGIRGLTLEVRLAQRGAWFPLLLLAVVTAGAIPVDRYGHYSGTCSASPGGAAEICTRYSAIALWYWPSALILAYGAAGWFYIRRSRRRGVDTPTRPYLVAGAVFALLFTGLSLWAAHHPAIQAQLLGLHLRSGTSLAGIGYRLISASSAIGLALLVLARLERSWAVAAVALAYLLVVLAPADLGWVAARPSSWSFLSHLVIDDCVLLAGAAAVGLAQRNSGWGAR